MTTKHLIPPDVAALYDAHEWRNAVGVLTTACNAEWEDILHALRQFRLLRSEILKKGGRKSLISIRFDGYLTERGWREKQFATAITIDGTTFESPTHKVDCYKNRVALEVEWNNKTEFYDRDLNNFRLLFELRAIDVGVIVTRCSHLQGIFDQLGRGKSYGPSTGSQGHSMWRIRCPRQQRSRMRLRTAMSRHRARVQAASPTKIYSINPPPAPRS